MSLDARNVQLRQISPPSEGPLRRQTHTYDLMRQCIHCGFCLPTCPTYAVLGVEMDSPRGRIYQMQAVAEGRMEISPEFVEHMYCCLGCRACETACPSGVQFGKLILCECLCGKQIHRATRRVLQHLVENRGVVTERLPRCRRRRHHNMTPGQCVLDGVSLMRVELGDATTFERVT